MVAFSAYYLNTPLDYTNLLIDKSFDSHQEYTIATSYLAPARGTLKTLYVANLASIFWGILIDANLAVTFESNDNQLVDYLNDSYYYMHNH